MKKYFRQLIFYRIYKKIRSKISAIINGNPAKKMTIIWITWTDGKTTTTNLIHKIINDNLWICVMISTSDIKIGDMDMPNDTKMSSLETDQLHRYLAIARDRWCKHAVLEVTSHWLDQYRFNDIDFDIWVLTNITSEHLDYHKNIWNYANTKKKLFESIIRNVKQLKWAVLPKDSEYWRKWSDELPFEDTIDYGIKTNASLRATDIVESIYTTKFDMLYLWKKYSITSSLLWEFNIQNILAAIWVWLLMWLKMDAIIKSIESFDHIRWRQERIEFWWVNYFIDFAHTPNALDKILLFLNKIKWKGKIITLFGATGNRDKYKRPEMWAIAEKNSDIVIVTDDDPDTENRYDIIKQVVWWMKRKEWDWVYIIAERSLAIKFAVDIARPWDIVLMAWKWHENIQLTNFWKRKWNDVDVLKDTLWSEKLDNNL